MNGKVGLRRKALAALLFLPLLSLSASAQTAFQPGGPTVTLSVTGASARVQVQPAGTGSPNMRVYNTGTVAVFLSLRRCGGYCRNGNWRCRWRRAVWRSFTAARLMWRASARERPRRFTLRRESGI